MSLGETDGVLYGNVEYESYQGDEVERTFQLDTQTAAEINDSIL